VIAPLLAALRPDDIAPGRSWLASPLLRRHAGPELLVALCCLLLLPPPLSQGDYAAGLAAMVRLQVLLCFFDMPALYAVGLLQRAPRWLSTFAVVLAYGAIGAGFAWFAWDRVESRAQIVLELLLPLALRAWSAAQGLADVQRAAVWIAYSLSLFAPWLLCFALVLVPLSALFGLETPVPGTTMVEYDASAWLAMGAAYFALAGVGRYLVARLLGASRAPA
jgi:hypothetical protein